MLEMWLLTVLGLSVSRSAIAALLQPCAIRSRTLRSRSVSSGKVSGAASLLAEEAGPVSHVLVA